MNLKSISITLVLIFSALVGSTCAQADSQDEQALITKCQEHDRKSEFLLASQACERLVRAYPASAFIPQANWILGQSYLKLHQAKQAVTPLKIFITRISDTGKKQAARILLGRAYVSQKKYHEAKLLSDEIVHSETDPNSATTFEALLLSTESELGMHQDTLARRDRDRAQSILKPKDDLELAKLSRVDLLLKNSECKTLAQVSREDERPYQERLTRIGTCLGEAMVPFFKTLRGDEDLMDSSYLLVSDTVQIWTERCESPPRPLGKRTKAELKTYFAETRPYFLKNCKARHLQLLDIINELKKDIHSEALPYITRLTQLLKDSASLWN